MRNFLTTRDIARLSGYSRAQIWNLAKAGEIPGQRVKYRGKRIRYIDSPRIRAWCETARSDPSERIKTVIHATVLEVIVRDGLLEKNILREVCRQLAESEDPDQLLKKWKRAIVEGRLEDLPHLDRAHLGLHVATEIFRQLRDSSDPVQLLKKWERAIVDRRPEDLPRAL
jgi:predicted DNA-binding transcriptional regulator AlpA